MQVYTAKDHKIAAKVGQSFQLELDGNPTTGYSWEVSNADGLIVAEASISQANNLVGAGGQQRFVIETQTPGDHRLELAYKRPWEKQAANTHLVQIQVR